MPTQPKIVQVDIRPERLGRRAKVDLGLCGSMKDTLQAVLPLVRQKNDDSFLKAQLELYAHVKKAMQTYVEDNGGASPRPAASRYRAKWPDNTSGR